MDGFVCLTIVVVIGLLGYWWNGYCSSTVTPDTIRSTHAARRTGYEFMSSLPTIYYGLAILCGVVLLIVTLINAKELSGEEVGYMIGWIFGSVLSMFAIGRVIELLQQIRDAVRNIPALSPGKSEDNLPASAAKILRDAGHGD